MSLSGLERNQATIVFLHNVVDAINEEKLVEFTKSWLPNEDIFSTSCMMLIEPVDEGLCNALRTVLDTTPQPELIIIYGPDQVDQIRIPDFVKNLRVFIELWKVKALLTSETRDELNAPLEGVRHIEYDAERKGRAPLLHCVILIS